MKTRPSPFIAFLFSGALALAQSKAPAAAPAANPMLEAIRTAPDPPSTIDAYVRGVGTGSASAIDLETAYVRRMADLGAPELAYYQAHDLIKHGYADATIAGIAAYADATRGDAHNAIANLKLALTYSPRDSFLLRTAGQAVAWYDSQAGQSGLSREDAAGVEWLRAAGNGSQEFTETYKLAMQARQAQAAQTTAEQRDQSTGASAAATRTTTSAEPFQTDQRSSGDQRSSSERSGETSTSYSYYYYPSSSSGSYYSGSYYPYAVYGCYGSASIIALRDGAFNRDFAALERSGAGGFLRGGGGDLRNVGGLPGNLNNLPGRGLPGDPARAFSLPGQAPTPRNGGPGAPPSMAGRPPQAPAGLPQAPMTRPQGPGALPQAAPRPQAPPSSSRPPSPPHLPRPPMPPGPPHP